jgi:hypothetical protein
MWVHPRPVSLSFAFCRRQITRALRSPVPYSVWRSQINMKIFQEGELEVSVGGFWPHLRLRRVMDLDLTIWGVGGHKKSVLWEKYYPSTPKSYLEVVVISVITVQCHPDRASTSILFCFVFQNSKFLRWLLRLFKNRNPSRKLKRKESIKFGKLENPHSQFTGICCEIIRSIALALTSTSTLRSFLHWTTDFVSFHVCPKGEFAPKANSAFFTASAVMVLVTFVLLCLMLRDSILMSRWRGGVGSLFNRMVIERTLVVSPTLTCPALCEVWLSRSRAK